MNGVPGSFIGNDRFECGEIDARAQAYEDNENACESLCETAIFVLPLDQVAIPFVSALLRDRYGKFSARIIRQTLVIDVKY